MALDFDLWSVLVVVDGERYAADELREPRKSAYAAAAAALPADATIVDAADVLERVVGR